MKEINLYVGVINKYNGCGEGEYYRYVRRTFEEVEQAILDTGAVQWGGINISKIAGVELDDGTVMALVCMEDLENYEYWPGHEFKSTECYKDTRRVRVIEDNLFSAKIYNACCSKIT